MSPLVRRHVRCFDRRSSSPPLPGEAVDHRPCSGRGDVGPYREFRRMPCNPLDALHDLRNQALSQLVTVLWRQRDSDCQSLLARTRAPKATDRDRTSRTRVGFRSRPRGTFGDSHLRSRGRRGGLPIPRALLSRPASKLLRLPLAQGKSTAIRSVRRITEGCAGVKPWRVAGSHYLTYDTRRSEDPDAPPSPAPRPRGNLSRLSSSPSPASPSTSAASRRSPAARSRSAKVQSRVSSDRTARARQPSST